MAKMKDSSDMNSNDNSNYSVNNSNSKLGQLYDKKSGDSKVYLPHQTNTIMKVMEGKPSSDSNNITIQEASVDAYTLFADRTQVCSNLLTHSLIYSLTRSKDNGKPIIKVEDWDSDDDEDDYDEEMSHKLSQGFVAPTVTNMGYSVNINQTGTRYSLTHSLTHSLMNISR